MYYINLSFLHQDIKITIMAKGEITNKKGLSSFWLRIIAILAMIWSFAATSDNLGLKNSALSDCMMWFSYTIFAFLLAEGINHTTNSILYVRRFALFTVISEFAYDYYTFGTPFNMEKQSIMLTLFICLLIMLLCDYLKRRFRNTVVNMIAIVLTSIIAINITNLVHSEFGKYGVLIAMLFYSTYDLSYPKFFEIATMGLYSFYAKIDTIISVTVNGLQYTVPITVFAILGLLVTWFYNEKRGPNKLWIKIVFYFVYPLVLTGFALLKFFY